MAELIVNLEEFAELVGVTPETMRAHVKQVEGNPAWLVERGDRGRGYKIEAHGAVEWWQARREADELASQERLGQLQQLRLDMGVGAAEPEALLTLSGRQRREEYAAALEGIKYRERLGQLVEKAAVELVLTAAAVELRRSLQQLPAEFGIAAGLQADQVQRLEGMIERALDAFVTTMEAPDAFAG